MVRMTEAFIIYQDIGTNPSWWLFGFYTGNGGCKFNTETNSWDRNYQMVSTKIHFYILSFDCPFTSTTVIPTTSTKTI